MLNLAAIFFIFSLLISSLFLLVKLAIAGRAAKPSLPESGPPTYPFIGCLFSFYRNRRRLLDWYTGLLAESPTQTIVIRRLGAEPVVVTANPANVEYILKTNFGNFPKGKPFTDILGDLLGHGIFNVDGELWASQRKLASHEFSAKSLREFVVRILEEEVEDRLLPLLQSAVDDDMIIDLQDVLRRFAYDTICKVSLGTDPRCLDFSRPAPPLVEAFETAAEICAARATAPIYAIWKIKRALKIGSEKRLKEAVKIVRSSVEQIAANKKMQQQQTSDRHGDKIDLLSRLVSSGHGGEMVRDMVVSFIMAGRDTTSAAMTWLFYSLTRNRAEEQKLVSEVEATPFFSSYEALKGMKYLHACLLESMRLFPPVAWDSKHAADDDVLPDGTRIKKGNRVTYFPYGMGRMETLWGENRFRFEPDRWFEGTGDSKLLKAVSPFVFPVFQAGPRVCLGKEMALVQMKYVTASILRRFEFEPVLFDPPVFVPFLTAHMAGGFKVRVKERTSQTLSKITKF
ncbi:hypothetical protein Nepgr_018576 [Nepenthes gracilis]|uniref:Cytochrome P450 n=1 Tax=Nepenthes gracilis TaxID=150966 RepID=A0AAD3STK1_NEPGR|nr:hypothetical protein Nepgr_018576 [Nepenthes gracilis]